MKHHLNHIILHDGESYHLFERLGKDVPFEAYNPEKSIFSSSNLGEVLEFPSKFGNDFPENLGKSNLKSLGSFPQNLGKSKLKSLGIFIPPRWDIEEKPYEVVFNG